jgi:hypothetical protein
MTRASEKTMFEIYREASYNRRYKVVYFTELNDHNKEAEINRAIAGDHFLDGFLYDQTKEEAKVVIERALERLNNGEPMSPTDLQKHLGKFLA